MGAMFYVESPFYGHVEYDASKVRELMFDVIARPDGVVFVADYLGEPVGGIVGIVTSPWFSSAPVAQELAWFMDPDFRSGRTGLRLLRAFEAWAKEEGVDLIAMSEFEGASVKPLLRRYQPIERAYLREI